MQLREKHAVRFTEVTEPTDFTGRLDKITRGFVYPGRPCMTFWFSVLDPLPWRNFAWHEEHCLCDCDEDDHMAARIAEIGMGLCQTELPCDLDTLIGHSFRGVMNPA
ncbi:hypothetical protein DPM33_23605 [Mesorhizobium hawassense]|uniref:Uncharacterized protein n=2 Tax=Mesorhizobium hawassense TaxID=1209954 RepID=A0A330HP56_9HYPH|nr:hypothetical protein DPM33_23605 [Mesorhizobium hawassense]